MKPLLERNDILSQGAAAWTWARSDVAVPIPSFKTTTQVGGTASTMDFGPLSGGQMAAIDSVCERQSDRASAER